MRADYVVQRGGARVLTLRSPAMISLEVNEGPSE